MSVEMRRLMTVVGSRYCVSPPVLSCRVSAMCMRTSIVVGAVLLAETGSQMGANSNVSMYIYVEERKRRPSD